MGKEFTQNSRINELEELTKKLNKSEDEVRLAYKIVKLITDNIVSMLWAKDEQDRYLFANKHLCINILKCLPEEVIGKSDNELHEYGKLLGIENTFGKICKETDEITKREKKPCRFLEIGKINGTEIWLEVKKTPIMNGIMRGTVGVATMIPETNKDFFMGKVHKGMKLENIVKINNQTYRFLQV